ncbi:MAG: trypsin-like serine protease [Sulfurospirillaceae bacterium]|nr:trypsin-like serine protease [Sulfurospirillaceae bacterium]
MVTTLSNYLDSRYRADISEGYDGVVRVAIGGYYGTGTLLYDGKAIVTAAHLFEGISETSASVYFETAQGDITLNASNILLHPDYNPEDGNNDLALIWLTDDAPTSAERYDIYRQSDEISQDFTMVGYGVPGTGNSGAQEDYNGAYVRLMTQNTFDASADELKDALGYTMGWTPTENSQLIADFDNGMSTHDALGMFLGIDDTGIGVMEGIISSGDSGGPAFIEGKIAGIASYISSLETYSYAPDIDTSTNSSFGEIAAWQRVSYYQQWIDESIRSHYRNAPSKASDVQKSVLEGDGGVSYAYFLLEFTGTRSSTQAWVSVDYASRDGSAHAGEDYIAVSGTLILYPNENEAVIPVEIIGDNTVENNETFYMDVFNPIGGSFGEGIVTLTALRTIVNDDML